MGIFDFLKKPGIYKTFYYDNGKIAEEGYFKNNLRNGLFKHYHHNGQIRSEGIWKNGKRDGFWPYYKETGELESEETWEDGKLLDIVEHFESELYKKEKNVKAESKNNRGTLTKRQLKRIIREEYSRLKRRGLIREFGENDAVCHLGSSALRPPRAPGPRRQACRSESPGPGYPAIPQQGI